MEEAIKLGDMTITKEDMEEITRKASQDQKDMIERADTTKTRAENLTIQGQTITVRHLGVKEAVMKVDDVERLLNQQRQQLIGEILEDVNKAMAKDHDGSFVRANLVRETIKSKLTE